jgi:hypothetical protein
MAQQVRTADNTVTLAARLDVETAAKAQGAARAGGLSVSAWLARLIRDHLDEGARQ